MDATMIFLTRSEIAALMRPEDYLAAVEAGFRAASDRRAMSPPPLHLPAIDGGFHAKAATFSSDRARYAALKFNGNFPGNQHRFGLPTIQGLIVLSNADTGAPLAVMDSIEVTLRRTAAASAIAAKHLARGNSHTIALCGCGALGRAHLEALREVLPLTHGAVWDKDAAKAAQFAYDIGAALGLELHAVTDLRCATLNADIIVTCTTAKAPFLDCPDVAPGAFIAAVGADNAGKSEIAPALMGAARVFVDVLEQCAVMGDLRAAIVAGAMRPDDVAGDLAQLVSGTVPGRRSADEILVFDSTGTAIEDAASAAWIYERATVK
jgi:ornithine cyclodeaminase/alanine dehydrogenase-like protein (mu-crystallin family)